MDDERPGGEVRGRDGLTHRLVLDALCLVGAPDHRLDLLRAHRRAVAAHVPHHALEALPIGIAGAGEVAGDEGPLGGREGVNGGEAPTGDLRGVAPRDVSGDDRPPVGLRELDHRAVVGRVVRPGAGGGEEGRFGDGAGEVAVEGPLDVALEHLEGKDNRAGPPACDPLEDGGLQLVGPRVVVLFAEEDEVRLGEPSGHRLEVDDALPLGVVDPVGGVAPRGAGRGGLRRGRGRRAGCRRLA